MITINNPHYTLSLDLTDTEAGALLEAALDMMEARAPKPVAPAPLIADGADQQMDMLARANEAFANPGGFKESRKLFVTNFGWLLSQTRNEVERLELDDHNFVTIHFNNGHTRKVNVEGDSWKAIMLDVLRHI